MWQLEPVQARPRVLKRGFEHTGVEHALSARDFWKMFSEKWQFVRTTVRKGMSVNTEMSYGHLTN